MDRLGFKPLKQNLLGFNDIAMSFELQDPCSTIVTPGVRRLLILRHRDHLPQTPLASCRSRREISSVRTSSSDALVLVSQGTQHVVFCSTEWYSNARVIVAVVSGLNEAVVVFLSSTLFGYVAVTLSKTKKKGKEQKESLVKSVRDCLDEYASLYIFSFVNMRNTKFKEFKEKLKASSRCCTLAPSFVALLAHVLSVKCGLSGLNFFLLISRCSFDESM